MCDHGQDFVLSGPSSSSWDFSLAPRRGACSGLDVATVLWRSELYSESPCVSPLYKMPSQQLPDNTGPNCWPRGLTELMCAVKCHGCQWWPMGHSSRGALVCEESHRKACEWHQALALLAPPSPYWRAAAVPSKGPGSPAAFTKLGNTSPLFPVALKDLVISS